MKFRKVIGMVLAGVVAAGSIFAGGVTGTYAQNNNQEVVNNNSYQNALIPPQKNPEEAWGDKYKVELRLSNGVHLYLPSFFERFQDGQEGAPGGIVGYNIIIGNNAIDYSDYDEATNTIHKGKDYFESNYNGIKIGIQEGTVDILCNSGSEMPKDDEKHKYKKIGEADGKVYYIDFTPPYWDEGIGWESYPETPDAAGPLDYYNKYADLIAETAWVENDNSDETQSCEVVFNMLLYEGTKKLFSKEPSMLSSMLEKEKIKLYKLSYDRYMAIVREMGGYMGATMGGINSQAISEAELIDYWNASEEQHIVKLPDGDYFCTVNDDVYPYNHSIYFRVKDNGKVIKKLGFNVYTTQYNEFDTGKGKEFDLHVGSMVGHYADTYIKTTDASGNVIDCEIESYKKEGDTLNRNLILKWDEDSGWNKNDIYSGNFLTYFERPGKHIIRCKKVPYGYKKFDEVNIDVLTQSDGYPEISLDSSTNASINENAYFGYRWSVPAAITITLDEAEYGGLTFKNETSEKQTATITCNYEEVTGVHGTGNQGDVVFDKGVATVNIDPGESIIVDNIAEGTEYTVTADRCTVTGEKGTIVANKNCDVVLKKLPEKVSIDRDRFFLGEGESQALKAYVIPEEASDKTVAWSSSNTNVAKVDSKGKVTAVGTGTAVITATTVNGKSATCEVEVDKDTDGDGLRDDWEINGVDVDKDGIIDVPLNLMGADPNVPDIFVEVDWMYKPKSYNFLGYPISEKNYKPREDAMKLVYEQFKKHGINLHIDVGPDSIDYVTGKKWGNLSGGNVLDYESPFPLENWNDVTEKNFNEYRWCIFRYCIFLNEYSDNGKPGTSGRSDGIPSQRFIVANCDGSINLDLDKDVNKQAGTFMHELGHTLGLSHGGIIDDGVNDGENYKPNYLSIMNYHYQLTGLLGTNEINYGEYSLPTLNEYSISEKDGLDPDGVTDGTGLRAKWYNTFKENEYETDYEIAGNKIDFNQNGNDEDISPLDFYWNQDEEDPANGVLYKFLQSTLNDWDYLKYKANNIGLGIPNDKIFFMNNNDAHDEISYEEAVKNNVLANPGTVVIHNINPSIIYIGTSEKLIVDISNQHGSDTIAEVNISSEILKSDYSENVSFTPKENKKIEIELSDNISKGTYIIKTIVECENGIVNTNDFEIEVIETPTLELKEGDTFDLKSDSFEGTIKWVSMDEKIAKIDNYMIVAMKNGEVRIEGETEDGIIFPLLLKVVKKESSEPTQNNENSTEEPTQEPTEEPTQEPTEEPTQEPTQEPTEEPTQEPTGEPTQQPNNTKQSAAQSNGGASNAQVVKASNAKPVVAQASKTGDTNLTALWITLSAVSAGILGAIIVAIKKRRTE